MLVIAVLARYYFWRQDYEVLAQRSTGRSCWQIASPAIFLAICAGMFTAAMSLYALPASIGTAEEIRSAAALRIRPSMLDEGAQNQVLPGVAISFQRWRADNVIDGVVLTDDRKSGKHWLRHRQSGDILSSRPDGGLRPLQARKPAIPSPFRARRARWSTSRSIISRSRSAHRIARRRLTRAITRPISALCSTRLKMSGRIGLFGRPRWRKDTTASSIRCALRPACVLLILGVLVPGRQGYAELIVRLVLAIGLAFLENTASTIAFTAAQRDIGGGAFLYLLPAVSSGLQGAILLCWGDRAFIAGRAGAA